MSTFITSGIADNPKTKELENTLQFLMEKIAKLIVKQQESDAKIAALVQRIEQLENKK